MANVTISRDPDDTWTAKGAVGFRAIDAQGPVTILIDQDEWAGIVDAMALEASPFEEIPDAAYIEVERMAARESAQVDGDDRLIDLRPKF